MPRPDGLARAALRLKPSAFAGGIVVLGPTAVTVPARAALRRETLER
ncbi:hypothetical protein [Streptomyces collinus]